MSGYVIRTFMLLRKWLHIFFNAGCQRQYLITSMRLLPGNLKYAASPL